MADRARPDDVRSALLQAMSHELRTPLAAILGLAVTLERTDIELAPEEARDLARRITANARKLDGMLTDLLDLDRLERGVVEADLFPTDLGELVREVVAGSELALQERVTVEAPSLTVSIDGSKAARIVESLLSNAVRHTRPGRMVRVRVERVEAARCSWSRTRAPGSARRTGIGSSSPSNRDAAPPTTRPAWGWAWPWRPGSPR
jgi:two-component system sensor histidine kinase KdpD